MDIYEYEIFMYIGCLCIYVYICIYVYRLSLLEDWRGLRDDVFIKKFGIEGCIFVYAGGFIGGNYIYEGVLEMVKKSLKMVEKKI